MRFFSLLALLGASSSVLFACGDDTDLNPGGGSPTGGADTGGAPQGGGGAEDGGAGGSGGNGGEATGGGGAAGWISPTCTTIEGTGAVSITRDAGDTLLPTSEPLQNVTYTLGLVALEEPNHLLAASAGTLLRSEDAGCTWTEVGELPNSIIELEAGEGDIVYGWYDNQDVLARIEGDTITVLDPPGIGLHGVGIDPANGLHVRVADDVGQIHDSIDGGENWTKIGKAAGGVNALIYTVEFDPTDLDRAVAGLATQGVLWTDNAAETWTKSEGVGVVGNANAFKLAYSHRDHQIVWLEGLDMGTAIGEEIRRIWRSEDGGVSFQAVLDDMEQDITLYNGNYLAPDPKNASVLYFVFGTYFQGYGTDVYRYDHANGDVTIGHNEYNDVSAIAFHPTDPEVLYLGLTADAPN